MGSSLHDFKYFTHSLQLRATFQYRYTEVPNTLWSIDSWIEDILLLIDRFYDMRGPVNLISRGAGANAALRAAICKWQQCCRINVSVRPDKLNALVFISPAVGVDLEYFNRLSPNSVKLMRQGETAVVPSITVIIIVKQTH